MENKKSQLIDQWFWLDKKDQKVLGPFNPTDLYAEIFFKKKPEDLQDLYVWCKGFSDWQELQNCHVLANLVKDLRRDWSTSEIPPVFKLNQKENSAITNYSDEEPKKIKKINLNLKFEEGFKITKSNPFDGEVTPVQQEKIERRRAPRSDLKLKVLLTNGKNTFLTYTQNISESGILLESKVQKEFVGEGLQLLIEDAVTKKRIKLKCQGIIESENINRVYFVDLNDDQKEIIQSILKNTERKATKAS